MPDNKSFFQRFKKSIISFLIFILLMLALADWLGFKHVPEHVSRLWNMITSFNLKNLHEAPTAAGDTAVVQEAVPGPMEPLDTVYWHNQIKNGGYVPDDVKRDIATVRKIDFSKLTKAPDSPTSVQAQEALVRRLGPELIKLLKNHDAHIKVGKCFTATPDPAAKNKELLRVTAMVCAFNSKDENLRNISEPLGIVYDFVKYEADPDTWYVTDFSQTIPYDHQLYKE